MHGGPASTGSPMPGAPLLARPSAESVLPPQGGRGIARRLCVNPLAPLRGGVGVGGGGSNSDVRACARRPYNAWFAATRVLRLRPPPRSAFQAESASSQGGGKASPALLQSERIML